MYPCREQLGFNPKPHWQLHSQLPMTCQRPQQQLPQLVSHPHLCHHLLASIAAMPLLLPSPCLTRTSLPAPCRRACPELPLALPVTDQLTLLLQKQISSARSAWQLAHRRVTHAPGQGRSSGFLSVSQHATSATGKAADTEVASEAAPAPSSSRSSFEFCSAIGLRQATRLSERTHPSRELHGAHPSRALEEAHPSRVSDGAHPGRASEGAHPGRASEGAHPSRGSQGPHSSRGSEGAYPSSSAGESSHEGSQATVAAV